MGYSIYRILEDGPTKLLGGWLYSSFVYLAEVLRKFGIEIHWAIPVYVAIFLEEALPDILERYDEYCKKQIEFAKKLSRIVDKLERETDKIRAQTLIKLISECYVIGFFG